MSNFPISCERVLSDPKTLPGNAFQKYVWVHAFSRSMAERDGNVYMDISDHYEGTGMDISNSVSKMHKLISEGLNEYAQKNEHTAAPLLQKWDQCLMAALIDILG